MSTFDFEKMTNTIRGDAETALAALSSPTVRAVFDNQPTPSSSSSGANRNLGPWSYVAIMYGDTSQRDMGATVARFRRIGVLRFGLHSRIGIGEKTLLTIADSLVDWYRKTTLAGSGGNIRFRSPNIVRVGLDGNWWRLNVDCPFFSDDFK